MSGRFFLAGNFLLVTIPGFLALTLNDIWTRTATGAIAVIALLATSYRLWENERRQILVLQSRLDRKVQLHFDEDDPDCMRIERLPVGSSHGRGRVFAIRVRPDCRRRVNNCQPNVLRVYRMVEDKWKRVFNQALPLRWANYGGTRLDIVPDMPVYFDVIDIFEIDGRIELPTGIAVPEVHKSMFSAGGIFRIDVNIVGDDDALDVISIRFEPTGIWDAPKARLLSRPDLRNEAA